MPFNKWLIYLAQKLTPDEAYIYTLAAMGGITRDKIYRMPSGEIIKYDVMNKRRKLLLEKIAPLLEIFTGTKLGA